jgi:hypothetical protein
MERDALRRLLRASRVPFVGDAQYIESRLGDPGISISVSKREIPVLELVETYRFRYRIEQKIGVESEGVKRIVDLLERYPGSYWRVVSVSGSGIAAAVFVHSQELDVGCLRIS